MRVAVDLPPALLYRLRSAAARRGVPVEVLVAESLERRFPPPRVRRASALSFIGIGEAREDLGESHKQIRRELAAIRDVSTPPSRRTPTPSDNFP